jgi:hypothetical protein
MTRLLCLFLVSLGLFSFYDKWHSSIFDPRDERTKEERRKDSQEDEDDEAENGLTPANNNPN